MILNKTIIGAVHFAPMIGYSGFREYNLILEKAEADLKAFIDGEVDAIIFENNYDLPHRLKVGPETVSMMTKLISELSRGLRKHYGVSVLWNDYEAALSIARTTGASFVRVPVFVDDVKTDFGVVKGCAEEIIEFRKKIGAEDIKIFTDIQVKHATLLSDRTIGESAKLAIRSKSDGLIITGKWTGDAPELSKIKEVRENAGEFPVIVGSGCSKDNIKELFKNVDAVIVSTSLKAGDPKDSAEERNVKGFSERIVAEKVREFVAKAKE